MSTRAESRFVAIIDDDESLRHALLGLLKSFASAEQFLESGQQKNTGCLITDIRMPGISGLELQARLFAEKCRIPTIFITAHGDDEMRLRALLAGAVAFLPKPFDDEVLIESVRAALNR
jgi:FixJ family two-component response regulator